MKNASISGLMPARHAKEAGFTLAELLVTVLVISILATLAVPSFREFMANQRVKTASFDIMAMLALARSEAIKRNVNVDVFAGDTGFAVMPADGTGILLNLKNPVSVNFTGGGNVQYNSSGRLNNAATAYELTISSASSTLERCIRIDLSGRPNVKNNAC